MAVAYLGLGSNMGDKKKYLHRALQLLNQEDKIKISNCSSFYETEPWGYENQDVFMNIVIEIETQLTPLELLQNCQKIEQKLDRVREFKWGPRTMDIDILLYDDEMIETTKLKIPHPYLLERDFTVLPLAEIAPNLVINNVSVKEWATKFDEKAMKIIS